MKLLSKSAEVIDYFICGIAYPVKIDSLATHDPLKSRISQGTVLYELFSYAFLVCCVIAFGNMPPKGKALLR